MTGSILSVASEDGKVRLFKCKSSNIVSVYTSLIRGFLMIATYAGDWQLYGTFSAEAPVDDPQDGEDGGRMQE